MQPFSSTDLAMAGKNSHFILSARSDFHMINNLSIAIHAFPMYILTLLSVDEILLPRYVNWSINFKDLQSSVEMASFCLKHSTLFYLSSRTGQCLLPSAPAEIWFGQVYLWKVQDASVIVSVGYCQILDFF